MWNSQTVMLALVKKGLTREDAYEIVQRNAMQTWQAKHKGTESADFLEQLLLDPAVSKHLTKAELQKLCNVDFHFRQIKARFRKLGIST
jgi:adenylosuccinate lyase